MEARPSRHGGRLRQQLVIVIAAFAVAVVGLPGAVLAPTQAHAAFDPTVFARDCNPTTNSYRSQHECINPTSLGGATLSGSGGTITDGQRLQFSVDTGVVSRVCPTDPTTMNPGDTCYLTSWPEPDIMAGASYANWALSATTDALSATQLTGCGQAFSDNQCDFTMKINPNADPPLPDRSALRVTAYVQLLEKYCTPNICAFKPATSGGGGILDWKLVYHTDTTHVVGAVLRGAKVGIPDSPAVGVPHVAVKVAGTTAKGKAFSGSGLTTTGGRYSIKAPDGKYTVSFPPNVCVKVPGTACKRTAKVTVSGKDATMDAIAQVGVLRITLTPKPGNLTLTIDKKTAKTTPKPVEVTVSVTNTGKSAVDHVTPPKTLTVSYASSNAPAVPTIPLRHKAGPSLKTLGTLQPGATKKVTYTLNAEGDGAYNVEALVLGSQPGISRIAGLGHGKVTIGAPILVATLKMGRAVHSPSAPKLVKAGTAFVIEVTLENRSYTKPIVVKPIYPDLKGNALDGHVQDRGDPIQNVQSLAAVHPSPWVQIDPRQTKKLEAVIRTTNIPADIAVAQEGLHGGTRATITFAEPVALYLDKDGQPTTKVAAKDVFVDGPQHYEVGLDERDLKAEPQPDTYAGRAYYFTQGMFQGLWNVTGGTVHALFTELPKLVGKGIANIPYALESYVQAEAELWDSIKDDPVKRAAFFIPVENAALLAYKNAPQLIKNVGDFKKQVDAAVLSGYTTIWNDWYDGDWTSAMKEFGREGTERVADIAMAVAPGILARLPKVTAAFNAAKASLYAQITEDLAAFAPKVLGAFEALDALKAIVKPGFEFTNTHMRQMFGLTNDQTHFLRAFAKENELLIVIRSRAAESVKWLKKYGAVLKPEAIKLKTVSWLDVKYLGFDTADVGRVVFRKNLPSKQTLEHLLNKHGFGPNDAEWVETLQRLQQRESELTKTSAGNVLDLEKAAKDGHMDMHWNFAENSVDPGTYTNSATRYDFRIHNDGGGNFVPQYYVNGDWRSITGDVDFLQITKANGAALTDTERVTIYQKLAKSAVGFLHPESATWTNLKEGLFSFEDKLNEFRRAGTVAQFAPDGLVRAVTFNEGLTEFVNKLKYRIGWNGGYVYPLGVKAP